MTDQPNDAKKFVRPPVIVVVGHIDHGKTTMLDWYRKTKAVEKESGGITQHIGAYEVAASPQDEPPSRVSEGARGIPGVPRDDSASGARTITFIDTPGHEAFSKIRARGAHIADLGILVVAADEGVKPQTREAIAVLRQTNTPFAVALNKIDKEGANPERVKQELAGEGVLVEGYGGHVPVVEVSAKTGKGMEELLATLGLMAELEELTADLDAPARGVVIEVQMDPRRGIAATLLVQDGMLKRGDTIAVGSGIEAPKILENFVGRAIDAAGPSSPVRVTGLEYAPAAGDEFRAFGARSAAEDYTSSLPPPVSAEGVDKKEKSGETRRVFNIVLKADVFGSLEAVREMLAGLSGEQVSVRILKSEVGDISESDVKLAASTRLVTIVGFRVRTDASVRELARTQRVKVVTGEVIYDVAERVKEAIVELIPAEIRRMDLGRVKILKVFKKENSSQIVGGRVVEGKIVKGAFYDLLRMRDVAGMGVIAGLQRERAAAEEVGEGFECGIMADGKGIIREGDELLIYQRETHKITF